MLPVYNQVVHRDVPPLVINPHNPPPWIKNTTAQIVYIQNYPQPYHDQTMYLQQYTQNPMCVNVDSRLSNQMYPHNDKNYTQTRPVRRNRHTYTPRHHTQGTIDDRANFNVNYAIKYTNDIAKGNNTITHSEKAQLGAGHKYNTPNLISNMYLDNGCIRNNLVSNTPSINIPKTFSPDAKSVNVMDKTWQSIGANGLNNATNGVTYVNGLVLSNAPNLNIPQTLSPEAKVINVMDKTWQSIDANGINNATIGVVANVNGLVVNSPSLNMPKPFTPEAKAVNVMDKTWQSIGANGINNATNAVRTNVNALVVSNAPSLNTPKSSGVITPEPNAAVPNVMDKTQSTGANGVTNVNIVVPNKIDNSVNVKRRDTNASSHINPNEHLNEKRKRETRPDVTRINPVKRNTVFTQARGRQLKKMRENGVENVKTAVKSRMSDVLTHVLDGYVIQESNVAFPICKPAVERTVRLSVDAFKDLDDEIPSIAIVKERLKIESDKGRVDAKCLDAPKGSPFDCVPRADVKNWTTEQLTNHLSAGGWGVTSSALRDHEIDGESLLLVSKPQLVAIGVREEHADAILAFVSGCR